jgi:hypothetical protein
MNKNANNMFSPFNNQNQTNMFQKKQSTPFGQSLMKGKGFGFGSNFQNTNSNFNFQKPKQNKNTKNLFDKFNSEKVNFGASFKNNNNSSIFSGINTKKAFNNSNMFSENAKKQGNVFLNNKASNNSRTNMGFFNKQSSNPNTQFHKKNKVDFHKFNNTNNSQNKYEFGKQTKLTTQNMFASNFEELKNKRLEKKLESFKQKKGKIRFNKYEKFDKTKNKQRPFRNKYQEKRKFSNDDYIAPSLGKKTSRITKKKRMTRRKRSTSTYSDNEKRISSVSEEEPNETLQSLKKNLKAKLKKKKTKKLNFSIKKDFLDFNIFLNKEQIEFLTKHKQIPASTFKNLPAIFYNSDEATFTKIKQNLESNLIRSDLMNLQNLQSSYHQFMNSLSKVILNQ